MIRLTAFIQSIENSIDGRKLLGMGREKLKQGTLIKPFSLGCVVIVGSYECGRDIIESCQYLFEKASNDVSSSLYPFMVKVHKRS